MIRKLLITIALLFSILPNIANATEVSWSSGAYDNNLNISETLFITGASSLEVSIEGITESSYDFLTIFDDQGNQIGRYAGEISEVFTVSGSSINLQFTSDSSITKSGVTVAIRLLSTEAIVTETSWHSGIYASNLNISETLFITDASSLEVSIEGSTEAQFDFLTIFDAQGNQIEKYDGVISEVFTVSGSSITLQFTSDGSVNTSGVTVSIIDVPVSQSAEVSLESKITGLYVAFFNRAPDVSP